MKRACHCTLIGVRNFRPYITLVLSPFRYKKSIVVVKQRVWLRSCHVNVHANPCIFTQLIIVSIKKNCRQNKIQIKYSRRFQVLLF